MDLQAAFRARLLADVTLAPLIGGRIYWGDRPQGSALPALVLTKVAPGREWTHDGPNALVQPWVQIDIWSADIPAGAAIAIAVQGQMERVDAVAVAGWIFLPPGELINDQWPGPDDLPGVGPVYRIMQDYRFYAQPE